MSKCLKIKDTPAKHGYNSKDYNRRVVYEHYYDNEKLPFYVGKGKIRQAFDFKSKKRNKYYNEKAICVDLIKVNIVSIDICKEDAKILEKKLITKYKRQKDGGSLINIPKRKIKRINHGITIYQFDINGNYINSFSSISEASKQTGIIYDNIWKCANGYSSYSHAGGYKWRYTKEFTHIENSRKTKYNYANRNLKVEYEKYKEVRKEKRKKQRKEARETYLKSLTLVVDFN